MASHTPETLELWGSIDNSLKMLVKSVENGSVLSGATPQPSFAENVLLMPTNPVGNWEISQISQPKKASKKLQFCLDWFAAHPDEQRSGRELETQVKGPDGTSISYKTWNEARKSA